jgi:hypothetical protein
MGDPIRLVGGEGDQQPVVRFNTKESVMGDTSAIREHMAVVGSDGKFVGKVDRAERLSIKLIKDSPNADGEHRYIPLDWVERVDEHVHLRKPAVDVQEQWQAHPVEEGEYVPDE